MYKKIVLLLVLVILIAGCAPRAIDEVDRATAEDKREDTRHKEEMNKLGEQLEEDMLPFREAKKETEELWLLAAFCFCLVILCACVAFASGGGTFHGVRLVGAKADGARLKARMTTQAIRGPLDVVNVKFSRGVVSTTAANLFLHGGVVVDDKTGDVVPIGPMERDQIPELARVLGMSSAALLAAERDGEFVITAGDFSQSGGSPELPAPRRRGKVLLED